MSKQWVRVPVLRELNPIEVWEHTPLNYYGSGEYPRFIRPVRDHISDSDYKWVLMDVKRESKG